jgi:hypothetical protein
VSEQDKQQFAVYEAAHGDVLKDGHTMFTVDVARDLNRKSFLEGENVDLRRENAELKQERQSIIDQHDMWKQQWHELNESLPKRSLEQQIKALKGFANTNGILRQEPSTRSLHELIMELEKELSEALESDND